MVSRAQKKQVPDGPFHISETAWYYVDRDSITVVSELRPNNKYVGTVQTIISKRKLKNALDLMERD